QNLHTLFVIARVHPKVLGHNADMTYLLKINNLRNYVIGNVVKQSRKSVPHGLTASSSPEARLASPSS
ncbi:MAG: hypothetical protein LBV26_08110, partial [Bacteroidales bacterium]|nr:hypothetical protein [Bacteroidales bacterium]